MRKNTESNFQNPLSQEKMLEAVRKVAYELYEKRGHASGNEWADWFEAERLVKKELTKKSG